jgi:hypothetical protein
VKPREKKGGCHVVGEGRLGWDSGGMSAGLAEELGLEGVRCSLLWEKGLVL